MGIQSAGQGCSFWIDGRLQCPRTCRRRVGVWIHQHQSVHVVKWIRFFASSVPQDLPRPLVLIMDGWSSHYAPSVLDAAIDAIVYLMCLPANATHLFQPLDVAVFAPFKSKLTSAIDALVEEDDDGFYSINKAHAIKSSIE